jgi:N-acyl-D-aspartate/D-glutamate deacylase
VLRKQDSITTLENINAFSNSSMCGVINYHGIVGYVYVPRALVNAYKTATNWSTYANYIRAIEDYSIDGTVTGELDETKI